MLVVHLGSRISVRANIFFSGISKTLTQSFVALLYFLSLHRSAASSGMARLAVSMATLLLIAESQTSDVADRSAFQGFLSKYMPSRSDVPKSSMGHYDKLVIPNFKHGHGSDAAQVWFSTGWLSTAARRVHRRPYGPSWALIGCTWSFMGLPGFRAKLPCAKPPLSSSRMDLFFIQQCRRKILWHSQQPEGSHR